VFTYSPEMNRWLTRDPLRMVDGPNMYAYVRGNPVSFVDPLGVSINFTVFLDLQGDFPKRTGESWPC